jgi:uncharacterized damage-inducible protein DinB
MTPDQARFLFEFLLPQLESEHSTTRKILSSVPPGKGGYRPDPKSKSAVELARHIAVVEIWFLDAIINRRFGEVPPLPEAVSTSQHVAQWYSENFTRRMAVLKELSNGDLAVPVDFIGLRKDPAVAYLNIAIRHSVHHRGQLSAYLRPIGARVPAIYVESADDEPFPGNDGNNLSPTQRPPAF